MAALWIACAWAVPLTLSAAPAQVEAPSTFTLELYAHRSLNYLDRMVDSEGLPYFDVFWTDPAEAAHDWPDFGDVMSRQFQAAIMARRMTGESAANEKIWRKKILSLLDPNTGLLMRPQTNFSSHVADPGDQSLTLYALTTAYLDSPDESLKRVLEKMVDSMLLKTEQNTWGEGGFLSGFVIKSLMSCGRACSYPPAIRLAGIQVEKVMNGGVFTPDNTFRQGGHMHGNLRTLVGLADYALYERDPILFSRVDGVYRYVRSQATDFGFMPEVIGRKGDVVATETCALMDYIGLAVTLANHGHPEYWDDVERVVRNQLVESQLTDLSWLKTEFSEPDSAQFSQRDLSSRLAGAYAGWSSPTHLLAAHETLQWGGPELRGKTRLLQNCCGGSGTHAFFIAWENAARFEHGTLSVNLHIDRLLPQAEIRGYQPFQGLLKIQLKQSCAVRVRIPDFVQPRQISIECNGKKCDVTFFGNYLELGQHSSGEMILIHYPLELRTEEVSIGNPGFRQYHYRVTWKGDTVVRMQPLDDDFATGYSDFEKKQVQVFYGTKGPNPLYQRENLIPSAEPKMSKLHLDDGSLDLWANLGPVQNKGL